MSNRHTSLILAVALTICLVSLGASPAYCLTKTVPVSAHVEVGDGKGDVRILVSFGDLGDLTGTRILYAKCYLDINVDTCTAAGNEVEIRPMWKAWDYKVVTWTDAVDSSESALARRYARHADLQRGPSGLIEVVLTEVVRAWTNGKLTPNGLTLTPLHKGCAYRLKSNTNLVGGGFGKLVVEYLQF